MVCSSRPNNGAGDGFRGEVRTAFKLPGQVPDRCRLCRGAIRACYWEVEIKRKGASSALGKKRLFDSVGPGALGMGESTILGTDCRKTQPNNARSCTARRSRGTNSGCQTVSPIALISWTSRSIALALASAIGRHAQAIEVLSASFAYRKKHPRCRSGADIAIPSGARKSDRRCCITGSDHTPSEGLEVTGWPVTTLVRGTMGVREGTIASSARMGQHVSRDRAPYAMPASGPRPKAIMPGR